MVMRSIASRMALWVLAGSALVLGLIGIWLLDLTRAQILEHTHHEAAALAANAGSQIQNRLDRVAVSARIVSSMIATQPGDAEQLLRDALKANTDLSGMAAAFKPLLVQAHPDMHSPFVSRGDDGKVISRDLLEDTGSYAEQTWFLGGLSCSAGCWQRPFFSKSRHRQLINYSFVIDRDNHPVGIINADVTLDWLHKILASVDKPPGAYVFVLDSDGNYLAHDNPNLLSKRADTPILKLLASDRPTSARLPVAQNTQARGPVWIYSEPIDGTRWRLGLAIPEIQIYAGVRHIFLLSLALGLLALFGVAMMTLLIIRRMMAPLGVLADRAAHVARGELDFELPAVKHHDEVGSLTKSFDRMRHELALHMEDLARVAREKQRLASELEIAHQIQIGLLPNEHYFDINCTSFELHAALRPARAVGGDLYSYFMLDATRLYVLVGDVSDKGIPAALFMAQTITLAKSLAPRAPSPDIMLQLLNQELCRGNDSCMFVTLLCGLLDTGNGEITLASAGHEPPVLCSSSVTRLIEVETGSVLGLNEDASYPRHRMTMQPGQTLVLYTDGITEASNHEQQMYGLERTIECLSKIPQEAAPEGYIRQLIADMDQFVADAPQFDDITALALSWHGSKPEVTQLLIDNQLAGVFAALDQCDEMLAAAGTSPLLRDDIRLVLEELLVNTVSYGYPDARAAQISLQLEIGTGAITIELADDAAAFDPLQSEPPELTGDIADREDVGGLGVHLVRTLTSEMRYTHTDTGNHLQLRFNHPFEERS